MTAGNRAWLTIRSALFWIWMIMTTLAFGAPVLLAAAVSYTYGFRLVILWLRFNLVGLRILCGLSWRVEGAENIPHTPCIVLSKHQSTWETFFLPMYLGPSVYVAKRSLALIPIFGWALVALRFILIDRRAGRSAIAQMVAKARTTLALKRWIIIFPEGTRRPVGAPPDYRIGGAVVAYKTRAPVLPVAHNAGEFWPRMGFIKWPGEITVSFGPPISSEGKSASTILAATEQWIEGRMAKLPGRHNTASNGSRSQDTI